MLIYWSLEKRGVYIFLFFPIHLRIECVRIVIIVIYRCMNIFGQCTMSEIRLTWWSECLRVHRWTTTHNNSIVLLYFHPSFAKLLLANIQSLQWKVLIAKNWNIVHILLLEQRQRQRHHLFWRHIHLLQ